MTISSSANGHPFAVYRQHGHTQRGDRALHSQNVIDTRTLGGARAALSVAIGFGRRQLARDEVLPLDVEVAVVGVAAFAGEDARVVPIRVMRAVDRVEVIEFVLLLLT